MSSSQATVEPAPLGGYGKDFSGDHKQTRRGLIGKIFPTTAPPDVSPRTRIVAVCGVPDTDDFASPKRDGWFFSDFFLFHHLFRGLVQNQRWLTCCNSVDLVKKYEEYAHGDPRGERKIVMDYEMLPQVADMRVVPPKDLIERFRSTMMEEARAAVAQNEPLLVMIFGHGDPDTKGILIGTNNETAEGHHLKRTEAAYVLGESVNATILTTSCYGRGWAVSQVLNKTVMAATADQQETLAWPETVSAGRHCGSRFATALTNVMIRHSLSDSTSTHNDSRGRASLDPRLSETDIQATKSYAGLLQDVRTLLDQIDSRPDNGITFSAQSDAWETNWSQRTGIPIGDFEDKYNQLRSVPVGDYLSPHIDTSQTGYVRLGCRLLNSNQATRVLKVMARTYLNSYPGDPSAASNHCAWGPCCDILNDEPLDIPLEELYAILNYRMNKVMALATNIKDFLGVDFPDCDEVDITKRRSMIPENRRHLYKYYLEMVTGYRFFPAPEDDEGFTCRKGNPYLALVVEAAGWDKITTRAKLNEVDVEKLSGLYETMKRLEIHKHQSIRQALSDLGKEIGKRQRSDSPKRRRLTSPKSE